MCEGEEEFVQVDVGIIFFFLEYVCRYFFVYVDGDLVERQ